MDLSLQASEAREAGIAEVQSMSSDKALQVRAGSFVVQLQCQGPLFPLTPVHAPVQAVKLIQQPSDLDRLPELIQEYELKVQPFLLQPLLRCTAL